MQINSFAMQINSFASRAGRQSRSQLLQGNEIQVDSIIYLREHDISVQYGWKRQTDTAFNNCTWDIISDHSDNPSKRIPIAVLWKRTGHLDVMHTLNSMDLCRISWGKIKKISQPYLIVEYQPLVLEDNKLSLGEPVWQKINYRIGDKGFIEQPKQGDWISMHWGFACEVLSDWQIANLKKYTQESIALANMG